MVFMGSMNENHEPMELQQMRYVIALAEERSFTRAAARCFVVQSALSHQIKALEDELGAMLFARTSRRVELTTAGEAFVIEARATLAAADRAVASAAATTGEIRGELNIGVIPTVTAIDLPAALREFHTSHPAVRIRLRMGASDAFVTDIATGRLDAAVLGLAGPVPPKVASRELARERLVAVIGPGHRHQMRRRLRLRDIAGETFVDFPEGTPGRAQSDLAFAAADERREVAFEATSAEMILSIVAEGLAIALLPPAVVPNVPALRTVSVPDGPTRIEYLAWSDFNPSPAASAFVKLLSDDAG